MIIEFKYWEDEKSGKATRTTQDRVVCFKSHIRFRGNKYTPRSGQNMMRLDHSIPCGTHQYEIGFERIQIGGRVFEYPNRIHDGTLKGDHTSLMLSTFIRVQDDWRFLRTGTFSFTSSPLRIMYQSPKWGPDRLNLDRDKIQHASLITNRGNLLTISPDWYTRDGAWADSQAVYLSREMHNEG